MIHYVANMIKPMRILIYKFLLMILITLPVQALAETPIIRVATDNWIGYTNLDGSGYYFDILKL